MSGHLTSDEAHDWFNAAFAALSAPADRIRRTWVLNAKHHVWSSWSTRRRVTYELRVMADDMRLFNTFESHRDARILCFCTAVLCAMEVER